MAQAMAPLAQAFRAAALSPVRSGPGLLTRFIRLRRIVIYRAALPGGAAGPVPDALGFRALGPDDFLRGAIFREKNRANHFARQLEAGHRCYGFVTREGKAASYLWLSSPRLGTPTAPFELGLDCRIPGDAAYIWDCRVHPSYRNRGLYRHGLNRMMALAAESGAAAAIIASETDNAASNVAIVGAGFRAQHAVRVVLLMGRFVIVAARGGLTVHRPGDTIAL